MSGPTQDQEVLVSAMAPALPGYDMTADEWRAAMIELRMLSRGGHGRLSGKVRVFFEDVARAADAMHNRLNGAENYLGKEELDAALGPLS